MKNKTMSQPRLKDLKRIRVLMADPDDSLHRMYQEPLLREGFEVDQALNGLDCVAQLRERVPDVLVIEPQLPWGGGDGVLAVMGENPDTVTVFVMVLTSCRDFRVLNAVMRFPVSDYQLKPLAPDRLAERLRSLPDRPRLRFDSAEHNERLESLILQRTGGRIGNLSVETMEGRVVVHGVSHSHYVKQLALAAVQEAFDASPLQATKVELDIEVLPDDNSRSPQEVVLEARRDNFFNRFEFQNLKKKR